ncbi:MAG: TonB-dependent receptor plug domain-containing protein, partial [Bacteroidota bacterium]
MKKKLFILLITCFYNFNLKSQDATQGIKHELKGSLLDQVSNEPLMGAYITYENGKGVVSDRNGNFSLMLGDGDYTLTIGYLGYGTLTQVVNVNGSPKTLEPILLTASTDLNEVEIVADVAKSRETPIAYSDVSSKQINRELGSNDITMLMNSTPGAYATQQGGGAGDSRVNIRGFDQRYIGVLVDGVPVNDMENGRVFWSNWAGLAEVTQKIQVQRGLGASRLALPAVGGVMNIITNSIDQKKSLVVRNDMGTANYQRLSIGYNSGLIKNKIGFTLAGSYTGGDGYIDQTWQKTWSYFAKVSYKLNKNNLIILSANGAPQSHGQRSFAINMAYHDRKFAEQQGINVDSVYASNKYTSSTIGARGITYSPDWGYLNGKGQPVKINYFHKPLFNLS